jgi:prepilin-type N-terminal cleavage/methylation domain-containing protein
MRVVRRTPRSPEVARRGVTLLEVLVALVVLGLVTAAWVGLSVQSTHTVAIYHSRELQMQRATRELDRLSLWPDERLRGRIGRTRQGAFLLTVTELAPSLYGVVVADVTSDAPLLRTAFYAPDTIRTAR